jgi:hypothetical protein
MKLQVRSMLFRSPRSKLLAAGASFAAIALFVLILPATVASGQTSGSTSTLRDAGVLRLRLGAADHFRFEPTSGSPSTQSISQGSQCRLSLGSSPSLVSFLGGPSTPYAGFVGDAIGVRASGEGTGSPCGRIDPGQILTMNLGSALADKMIDFAEIDIEGKFGAIYKIEGYVVDDLGAKLVKSETYETSAGGSDSGPDSGDGDNFRVRFPKSGETTVNRLVFSIVGSPGAASLEGGSDGTQPCGAADCPQPSLGQTLGTTDSLFHLTEADGVLDCGDEVADTDPNDGIGLTIQRLDNVGGGCGPLIPYSQSGSSDTGICNPDETDFLQCIFLEKDLVDQEAQFLWTVTWAPEDGSYMETPTEFDFGTGPHALALCAGDTDGDGFPNLSGTDPWCVVNTSTDLIVGGPNNGLVVVTETYFGSGDPAGKRG